MARAAVEALVRQVRARRNGQPETHAHSQVGFELIRRQSDAPPCPSTLRVNPLMSLRPSPHPLPPVVRHFACCSPRPQRPKTSPCAAPGEHMVLQRDRPAVLRKARPTLPRPSPSNGRQASRSRPTPPAAGRPRCLRAAQAGHALEAGGQVQARCRTSGATCTVRRPVQHGMAAQVFHRRRRMKKSAAPMRRRSATCAPLTANVAPQSTLPAAPWVVGRAGQTAISPPSVGTLRARRRPTTGQPQANR